MTFKLPKNVEQVIHSQNRSSCACKNCGKFVGALEVCPFCRYFNRKRLCIFILKYFSPIAAVAGLVILYYVGNIHGSPQVKIAQLSARSNFAQVKISGTVASDTRYYQSEFKKEGGSLEFQIDDGTDIIEVRCYDDVTAELIQHEKIPAIGDKITIQGSYQFKSKNHFIILGSAYAMTIANVNYAETPVAKIARNKNLKEGAAVKVTGKVQNSQFQKYDFLLVLADDRGNTIKVTLPLSILQLFGIADAKTWNDKPRTGEYVVVNGILRWDRYSKIFVVAAGLPKNIKKVRDDFDR